MGNYHVRFLEGKAPERGLTYSIFTNGKGDWGIYRDGSDGCLSGMDFYGMPNDFKIDNYHKATVDELIEHFKTKEEQL